MTRIGVDNPANGLNYKPIVSIIVSAEINGYP